MLVKNIPLLFQIDNLKPYALPLFGCKIDLIIELTLQLLNNLERISLIQLQNNLSIVIKQVNLKGNTGGNSTTNFVQIFFMIIVEQE